MKNGTKGVFTPEQLNKKWTDLKSDRSVWESHWQEIADYIIPRKNSITTKRTPGEKKTFQLLDNTGVQSNELLAGFFHGMVTNPNGYWFELTTGDPDLDANDEVRKWMQRQERRMHNVINNSNFHTEKHEMDLDQCGFGTGCMLMEEDEKDVVRFSTKFIGEYCLDEDSKGNVNQIYRSWKWPSSTVVEEFGLDNVPEKVRECYHKNDTTKQWCLVHGIYPMRLLDPKAPADKWHSQYIIVEEKAQVLLESFSSFPYLTPRFSKVAGEKYGRGPGMTALPEVKVLNKMNETMLIGAQKVVDPPVQLPDDGFILPIITRPGGINYRRSGNPDDQIRPIFNDTRLDFGNVAMEDRRKRIRSAYYVDQLQLQQGGPMMTATEVIQRTEEQMRLLGPMMGRQQSEFLRPMADWVYAVMDRRGLIDPVPEILKGRYIGVRYSSFIARTQRVQEGNNTMRWLQSIMPFINLDPTVAENLDGDSAVRAMASVFAPPQEVIRSRKDVEKRREAAARAAAQQQQQQQQMADLAQGAQVTKTLTEAGAVT